MPSESFYLSSIVKKLGEEIKVDVCSLYTLNHAGNQLRLVATSGLSQSVLGVSMSVKQGLTGAVARTRRSLPVKIRAPTPIIIIFKVPVRKNTRAIWAYH